MKKNNLSPGDFPDIAKFSAKLKDTKFSEFHALRDDQITMLDNCLTKDIPRLMEDLPSEKDTPEILRQKLGAATVVNPNSANVPVPNRADKFGKNADEDSANPFGYAAEDEGNYWALQDSAERLYDGFEALGPEGGFLSPQIAKDLLIKTGLEKEQLRQIWNLSDIDRDGYLDHHEYVVAMFLCDAVIQKNKPVPEVLPMSVVPPSKRALINTGK